MAHDAPGRVLEVVNELLVQQREGGEARVWRGAYREEALRQQVATPDPGAAPAAAVPRPAQAPSYWSICRRHRRKQR